MMNSAAVAATAHANPFARFAIIEIKAHLHFMALSLHIPGNAAARNSKFKKVTCECDERGLRHVIHAALVFSTNYSRRRTPTSLSCVRRCSEDWNSGKGQRPDANSASEDAGSGGVAGATQARAENWRLETSTRCTGRSYFDSLTIAAAAFPATTQLADPATTASSSNQRNPKSSMHSGKSGLMMT